MIQRIKVDKWISDRSFSLKHPSGATKSVVTYLPSMGYEDSMWVFEKSEELGIQGIQDFIQISQCAGAYSRLWIGALDGLIAPMDVPPEGWTYPSGTAAEPQWFWQWTPSKSAEEILLKELGESNPLLSNPTHLKTLAPFQLERKHGAIAQVNAIDLIRLPDMFKPGTPFLFECEAEGC